MRKVMPHKKLTFHAEAREKVLLGAQALADKAGGLGAAEAA